MFEDNQGQRMTEERKAKSKERTEVAKGRAAWRRGLNSRRSPEAPQKTASFTESWAVKLRCKNKNKLRERKRWYAWKSKRKGLGGNLNKICREWTSRENSLEVREGMEHMGAGWAESWKEPGGRWVALPRQHVHVYTSLLPHKWIEVLHQSALRFENLGFRWSLAHVSQRWYRYTRLFEVLLPWSLAPKKAIWLFFFCHLLSVLISGLHITTL